MIPLGDRYYADELKKETESRPISEIIMKTKMPRNVFQRFGVKLYMSIRHKGIILILLLYLFYEK